MRRHWITIVAALGAAMLSGNVLAGTTLVYEARDSSGSRVYLITAEQARLELQPRGSVVLYDASTQALTIINHEEKTYTVITPKERKMLQRKVSKAHEAMIQSMKQSVAHLPPQLRKKIIQGTMAGIHAGQSGLSKGMKIRVERTGETDTVNGYTCEIVRLGNMSGTWEVCLASNSEVGIPAHAVTIMNRMSAAMRQIGGSVMRGIGVSTSDGPELEGVAVRTSSGGITYVLNETGTVSVDSGKFDVPDGYMERGFKAGQN